MNRTIPMNPKAFLNNMMNNPQVMNNPMAASVLNSYRAGNSEELNKVTGNIFQEYGTTLDDVKKQFSQQFGLK